MYNNIYEEEAGEGCFLNMTGHFFRPKVTVFINFNIRNLIQIHYLVEINPQIIIGFVLIYIVSQRRNMLNFPKIELTI